MFIEELHLIGFRNYLEARLSFDKHKTIIIGNNAQGKTNLLEVIQILSGLKSQRATKDAELINFSLETAIVHARLRGGDKVSVLIRPSGRRSIKVNDVNKSNRELSAQVSSVSFMSQDLELVNGSPSNRRDWLDALITQLDSSYDTKVREFQNVLSQRNSCITQLVESGTYYARLNPVQRAELKLWDELYITASNIIISKRLEWLERIAPIAARYYSEIAGGSNEELSISYLGSPLSQAELEANIARDFARMHSTLGPQRHDLAITINAKAAGSFASQGQRRSIVLALKLSELELLRTERGDEPILLLDDVLAELDDSRQDSLLAALSPETQVIITTTKIGEHLSRWTNSAQIIEIVAGRIQEHAETV